MRISIGSPAGPRPAPPTAGGPPSPVGGREQRTEPPARRGRRSPEPVAPVGHQRAGTSPRSTSWSGPCAAPRCCRSSESIRSRSPGVPSRTCSHRPGSAAGRRVPGRQHLRVEREPGQPVAAQRPSGRADGESIAAQAAARRTCSAARAAAGRCPRPAAPGGRRTTPGTTSARARSEVAKPDHAGSSSATQQPSGSCSSRWRVRDDPLRGALRGAPLRRGPVAARSVRWSSSKNASALSRSATATSRTCIGRISISTVGHAPSRRRRRG